MNEASLFTKLLPILLSFIPEPSNQLLQKPRLRRYQPGYNIFYHNPYNFLAKTIVLQKQGDTSGVSPYWTNSNIQNIIIYKQAGMADFNDFNIQLDYNNVGDAERAQKVSPGPGKSIPSDSIPTYGSSASNKNQQPLNLAANDYNLSNAAHPVACIATVSFKALAIFFYLFVGMFAPDVITFIIVMIMSSLDFWTVKNVTGRLLVGLRWWSDYDEKGEEVWRFESFDKEFKSNSVDKTFFWSAQLGSTAFWAIFLLIKILSLSPFWTLLNFINFGLSSINLYGYYKCRGDHNKKIKALQSEGIRRFAGKIFM